MTFTEAAAEAKPIRKTGHIRIHGPEAFAGMRKAGRLTAEALDLMAEAAKPGVTTEFLDKLAFEFGMDHGAFRRRSIIAAIASRSAPRSTMSSATAFPTQNRCAKVTSSTST